jgi:clan AA aspartic protease
MMTLDVIKETPEVRFSVDVELANDEDLVRVKDGVLKPEEVRRVRIRGMVDTGATRLIIPQSVATDLGLNIAATTLVQYADRRRAERAVADRVRLFYGGRSGAFSAIVEPARDTALIGAIVLEELDYLVDPRNQRLVPRDPNGTISEVE